MNHYPLFFTYRDRLFGNGFLAEVASHGRILCAQEDGEFWVYGVEPGGIAATGENPRGALDAYREAFTNVLFDLAAEAPSFGAFKDAVEGFFAEINEPFADDWRRAVDAVRNQSIEMPEIPRETADTPCFVKVEQKEQASFSPKDNQPAQLEPALAIPDKVAA